MNKSQSRIYVKERLEEYILSKGIDTKKPFHCLNPSHNDVHPSMSFDKKRNKAHCFACGADFDTFDLVGIDYALHDNGAIFKKAYEIFGVNANNWQKFDTYKYIVASHNRVFKTDYFHKRGLSNRIIKQYSLGYDDFYNLGTGGHIWKAAIIPTGKNSFTARNISSVADKRNRIRKQGGSPIFNLDYAFNSPKSPLFVVEGELDALSVIEAGGNAVGLGTVANWRHLAFFFKGKLFFKGFSKTNDFDKSIIEPIELKEQEKANIIKPKTIILALDNDQEGRHASYELLRALKDVFIDCVEVNVSLEYKDPNEALICNREGFIKKVQETIDLYGSNNFDIVSDIKPDMESDMNQALSYIQSNASFFLESFKYNPDQCLNSISTGFPKLDTLVGPLLPGLYIIGAISSLGKTTFLLQIADNIAKMETDSLIFSLEMSKKELIAKSLSRHSLLECAKHKAPPESAVDIIRNGFNGDESVMESYKNYASRIFINESVKSAGDIRQAVERHILFTGKKPVVFIDYIQILSGGSFRGTDKQNMDGNITELKLISRDFQIPIICVSSFNRQNYKESVSMEAFKESGAIEYSSDVLIGLQLAGTGKKDFDVDEEKRKNPRSVELKVLKNRHGKTGDVVLYNYYPEFNYFKEL